MGFGDVFKGLFGEVGNGRENRKDDVKQVKRGLGRLAYRDDEDEPSGYIDRSTDRGIRDFQEDEGLRVDGWMRSGGPTEDALTSRLGTADRLRYPDVRVKRTKTWQDLGWGGPRGPLGIPTLTSADDRTANILADRPGRFRVEDNEDATPARGWYARPEAGRTAVEIFSPIIEAEARRQGIEPDLAKAVTYVENMNGHYFGAARAAEGLGLADTILPMNINPEIWGDLGLDKKSALQPRNSIRAGVTLLKRIRDRVDKPTVAKVGSIWNYTGGERVSDFGAQVAEAYRTRPWNR